MSKHHNDDDSIKKLLSEMPQIKDDRSFEEYYEQISKEINKNFIQTKNKKGWLLPILTSAAALFLFVIIGLQFINSDETTDGVFQLSEDNENETEDKPTDQGDEDMEMAESNHIDDGDEESSPNIEESEVEEEVEVEKESEQDEANTMNSLDTRVLTEDQANEQDTNYITYTESEPESQFFIPLTYMLPSEEDPHVFFNESEQFVGQIDEFNQQFYQNMTFVGMNHESEPVIQVEEDNFQGAATEMYLFEALSFFETLGYESVELQDQEGESLDLPHAGSIEEYTFKEQKALYKLYQSNTGDSYWGKKYLEQNTTIIDALNELKNEEEFGPIEPPIPGDINFEIIEQGELLEVILESELELGNNLSTQRMIESILLTAKTFGFREVQFLNIEMDSVGPYDLTNPIEVPKYINVR
ncbi:hypothetical protein [Piscibacillus halophilus]|uniref:hypothetical protein n=1 Tax=Piscibacillus halophilus TaxID=571933 RepID=UPI00240A915C|nr:hypothetical protein [Piscibacillus halophilus]